MRAITECFRTTAITAMEHETELLSPQWHLTSKILRIITRMTTTAIIRISTSNKDEATKEHQQRLQQIPIQDLIIYTDESGHGGQIDAAIYSPTNNAIKGEYIGTDNTHNVYAAELTAIQMTIMLFEEKIQEHSNAYIFTDNQSAIQAIETPKQQFGQYIIESILDRINKIQEAKPTCNIHIERVSGYKDIVGNEQADQAAKAAATSSTTALNIRMKSAQNRSIQTMTKTKWEIKWKTGKTNARRLRRRTGTGADCQSGLTRRAHPF